MPNKLSIKEKAYAFRHALSFDLEKAGRLLKEEPTLLDYPIFGESESGVHFFAVENRIEVIDWLLARGANPDGISEDDSPLYGAAQLGHFEVCGLLVDAGADLDNQDCLEETPLHKASAGGYIDIIELLLKAGADSSITEMCGEAPVDQALPRKKELVVKVFESFKG